MARSILLTVPLALALAGCGSSPETAATRFVEAADNGHTSEALDHIDPAIKQVGGPKLVAAMGKAGASAKAKGGLKKVAVVDAKQEGDYATLVVEENFNNGTASKSNFKMRKFEGKWYVTM